ncbi:response regulator [Krasilnikovia sp. MM14-A1004]|uniref:response regulator n=1 Tax=Krasilnikovia sp. MM14-A1004 TaxID=3373541 RepID=UPI00399D1E22
MGRILVVDDEPDLRFLLRHVLASAGHEVTDAGDGAIALACVHESPPDLVVTDMMMPVMGGVEFIRRLRADPATAAIPVLAVTGDLHLARGADAMLAKPWQRAELLAAVDDLFRKGRDGR